MSHKAWLIPVIGALIGWITNIIAIRLLFRPYKPVNILGFKIQGLLPKRQKEIAAAVGKVVESELVSIDSIRRVVEENKVDRRIVRKVFYLIKDRIDDRLPVLLPSSVKKMIRNYIMAQAKKEIREILPQIANGMVRELEDQVSLKGMVENRVNEFDFKKLEEIVLRVSKKELRFVEVAGGILGFIIGLLQMLLLNL
ncbi:MAG: DUF445 family protein [Synergistetes bacterium]|nr:DUF445 family protein [Synergistota bacterium]